MQASSAAGAVRDKVLPTAQATGPKGEDGSGQSLANAAGEVKDGVARTAGYVADRWAFCCGVHGSSNAAWTVVHCGFLA